MKIGLEVATARPGMTGVGTYASQLAEALAGAPDLELRLFSPDPARAELGPQARARVAEGGHHRLRPLWLQAALPWRLAREGVDLLHATNFVAPLLAPCPTVCTIHDLGAWRHPEFVDWKRRLYIRTALPLAARRAAAVIAVSEATRADAVRLLGLDPARVFVVPEAAAPRFAPVPAEARAEVLERHGLRGPYVLAVGSLQARKNLERLASAHARLRAQGRPVELVLVGPEGAAPRALRERLRGEGVRALGYVPAEDLPALYSGASATAYVSLFEGFGLPVLEAMACGAPLLVAQGSALDEVVGEAALRADPRDEAAIAAGLARLLDEPALAAELAARGRRRAQGYGWARAAKETQAVYRAALKLDRPSPALPERPASCAPLAWAVLRTLAYADIFDSPLRKDELWRGLQGVAASQSEVEAALLGHPDLVGRVERTGELYHLTGRAEIVRTRAAREAKADRFLARQGPALQAMASVPFVRLLAFSGGAAHRTSLGRDDLDLFVVAARGRTWTAVASSILLTKLLGMRGDVCANYVVDEDHLGIAVQHDVYTAHQLVHLWPVLGEVTYRRLWAANGWLAEFFPNAAPRPLAPEGQGLRPARAQGWAERALEALAPASELSARLALTAYLRLRHGRERAHNLWLGPGVAKLHVRDHRAATLERFRARLAGLVQTFEAQAESAL